MKIMANMTNMTMMTKMDIENEMVTLIEFNI